MSNSPYSVPAAESSPVKSFWSGESYWMVDSDSESFVEVTHAFCNGEFCRGDAAPRQAASSPAGSRQLMSPVLVSPLSPVTSACRVAWSGDETLSPLPSTAGSVSSLADDGIMELEVLIPLALSPLASAALGPAVDGDARAWPRIPSPRRAPSPS